MHVGFLNMMPDSALKATERQFIRLIGSCNRIVQFYVYPFSLPQLERSDNARQYIAQYYSSFEKLQQQGLDALIITGANVANPDLTCEPFWAPLIEVVDWAEDNVSSILCSCLATHALLRHYHDIERTPLAQKCWGVYDHRAARIAHPLLRDINTRFDAPHSRHNDISREQLEAAGLTVLADSEEGGVHLAVSPDQFRVVYFQGHPEYDINSLFKEYKRELVRFVSGERNSMPPYPHNYFSETAERDITAYAEQLVRGVKPGVALEQRIEQHLDNTWGDTAKAIFNSWLGLVYQLTSLDRHKQFMDSVDPQDPLNRRPGKRNA